ncbi:hypothetical protein [Leifsonia sp. 2MCAF36]|uniref:hypothetical protein n=1 Tax=Leifsonia sp. 2MCAF36 TaxID=3232988 RepID=UPI003F9DF16B
MNPLLHPSLQGTLLECHDDCAATAAGHALSPMQVRLASATPSKWVDGVVLSVSKAGWIEVAVLSDDSTLILWNHDGLTDSLQAGDPVAVHSVYDVLAVSDAKYNVLPAGSL